MQSKDTISPMRKFTLIFGGFILTAGCHQGNAHKSKQVSSDELRLKITFRPAFEEKSEIDLVSSDSTKHIQIVLRNHVTAAIRPDTFYWKKIDLSDQQYSALDTTLIKLCRQNLAVRDSLKWVDGMTFSSILTSTNGTNTIEFFCQDRKNDSIGYSFAESLMGTLRNTFQDSVITEYFDDIEVYIDESKFHRADPRRKIDRMRMEKYHWTIQNSSQNIK
jgi:hypothetical protein